MKINIKLVQIIIKFIKSKYFWRFFALVFVICLFAFLILTDNMCDFSEKKIESRSKIKAEVQR